MAGVSLIEALVALAVMAFGILGVTGIQATLRTNADLSRQRMEAVRIAQEAMEQMRAFTAISTTAGQLAYNDLAGTTTDTIKNDLYTTSCASDTKCYTLTKTVSTLSTGRGKVLQVNVAWFDRRGLDQSVQMSSVIAGVAPELAGALVVAGDASPEQLNKGRNMAIPLGASDNGNGTSNYSPPGTTGVTWVFNNVTGLITRICNPTCSDANSQYLGGFVSFSTGGTPSASNPTSNSFTVGVQVDLTLPTVSTVTCAATPVVLGLPKYVEYACAIPLATPPASQLWSGTSSLNVSPPASGILSTTLSDATAVNVKVCRYTTETKDAPAGGNQAHPLTYKNVAGPLSYQNFLITSAGDGTSPYTCPSDGSPTVITYRHQPTTP